MNDNTITIHIDGRPVSARPGQMLIEVMDANDVAVPRFCYHPRLSVAANCRMCMVEVERVPKPLPACATPVAKDMIVRSRSKIALEGQKGTMEMLLINHPLDCPVCDQGGECELQDVSLAHGQSYSRYQEGKRAVEDEDIGSLISTDMTRCIHCTRCVRFGVEVAGQAELGATGRGEDMRIGTFVKHAVSSELSGNMIDVCPVGALNSRPYRMRARAWEMDRHESIAAHDCLGSHTYVHTLRGQVMRELPRECESINQSWLSDRDRFSYTALENPKRRTRPQIFDTVRDRHKDIDWYSAVTTAAKALLNAVQFSETSRVGVLVGAGSTLEEMHLLARLCARLGIENIDHRLTQIDFSYQDDMPAAPWLGCTLEQLAACEAIVLIGADVRKQQPLLGVRLRQAALAGAHISTLNLFREDLHFEADEQLVGDSEKIFSDLLSVFRHLTKSVKSQSATQKEVSRWTSKFIVKPGEEHKRLAARLKTADSAAVILGAGAFAWPNFSAVRALAQALSELTGARFGFLTPGANTVGAWFAGCVPHRNAVDGAENTASLAIETTGLAAQSVAGAAGSLDLAGKSASLAEKSSGHASKASTLSENTSGYSEASASQAKSPTGSAETSADLFASPSGSAETSASSASPSGKASSPTGSLASTSGSVSASANSLASTSGSAEAHANSLASGSAEAHAHSLASGSAEHAHSTASPSGSAETSANSSAGPTGSAGVSARPVKKPAGLNAAQMFDEPLDVYILFNCEPWLDSQSSCRATEALQKAKTVIDINTFSDAQQFPGVRLPLASIYESPGITINAAAHWQYRDACTAPAGQSLPGWKILSMLARACKIDDLDYSTCDDLSDEVVSLYKEATASDTRGGVRADAQAIPQVALRRLARPSCFQGDAVQRHSTPLQQTIDSALDHFVWLNPSDAAAHKVEHGDHVELSQEGRSLLLRAACSDAVSAGTVLTALSTSIDAVLGAPFGAVEVRKAGKDAIARFNTAAGHA